MAALTDKQEAFAIEYTTNGNNATQAYRDCYDIKKDAKDAALWVAAHNVLHNDKVSVRVHELRTMKFKKKILTIEERKQLLTEWAIDGSDKAIDLLNKMESVYVEKQQVDQTLTVNLFKKKPDGS